MASGKDHVFIKDDGHAFRKGTIGRRVKEVFKRAGVRLDVSITATRIRKMYSSSLAEMSPTKKRTINTHMKHKESTADSNYVLKINSKRASTAHQLMRNIVKEDDQDQADPATSSSKGPKSTAVTECKSKPTDTDSDDSVPLRDVFGKPEEVDHAATAIEDDPTNQLDASDKVVIASVFQQEIDAGQLLTRHEVRVKMRADQHLRKYVVHKAKVKKICDFIRYQTNHVRQLQHIEQEEEEDTSKIATFSTGSRREWDANATKAISQHFSKFTQVPSWSTILEILKKDPVLGHLLRSEGATRCYEKVKNTFRKWAKKE